MGACQSPREYPTPPGYHTNPLDQAWWGCRPHWYDSGPPCPGRAPGSASSSMISFEVPESIRTVVGQVEQAARQLMRPIARYYDQHEGEIPWEYIGAMHRAGGAFGRPPGAPAAGGGGAPLSAAGSLLPIPVWGRGRAVPGPPPRRIGGG